MLSTFIRFIVKSPLLRWIRKPLRRIIRAARIAIVSYEHGDSIKIFALIDSIKSDVHLNLDDAEAYQICMAVNAVKHIEGDMAEVGVYQGGSASLICEFKRNKNLHLFDTFEGIPRKCITEKDDKRVEEGVFSADLQNVKKYLRKYPNVFFYIGVFPETAKHLEDIAFSFVHLDVDTYRTTFDALDFFYPRMNVGGIFISHDYMTLEGVRKAFVEFFKDKSEPIIELAGTQCLVVKTQSSNNKPGKQNG